MTRWTASYSSTPVRTQISSTDTIAPSTSAGEGVAVGVRVGGGLKKFRALSFCCSLDNVRCKYKCIHAYTTVKCQSVILYSHSTFHLCGTPHTYIPALCQPNDIILVGLRLAIQIAKRLMRKLAKSDNMCAASVIMARLLDRLPPAGVGRK